MADTVEIRLKTAGFPRNQPERHAIILADKENSGKIMDVATAVAGAAGAEEARRMINSAVARVMRCFTHAESLQIDPDHCGDAWCFAIASPSEALECADELHKCMQRLTNRSMVADITHRVRVAVVLADLGSDLPYGYYRRDAVRLLGAADPGATLVSEAVVRGQGGRAWDEFDMANPMRLNDKTGRKITAYRRFKNHESLPRSNETDAEWKYRVASDRGLRDLAREQYMRMMFESRNS